MILDESTAKEIAQNPRNKKHIQEVKDEESRLRVMTESMEVDELGKETYWSKLLDTMKKRSSSKFSRVLDFARYPLPVVQLTESVLTDLYKVFDAKNQHFSVDANREIPRLEQWLEETDVVGWIEHKAKNVLKNKPNSFVVVDKDEAGIPYLILVDSDRLVDAQFKKNGEGALEYIAFIHSVKPNETKQDVDTTFFSVYDEERYFVFSKDDDSDDFIKVEDVAHNIGHCPGHAFMRREANSKNPFKRRVAFTPAGSKLEDWTLFDIFRSYVDHYAPFPITESTINPCANPDCHDGKIKEEVIVDAMTNQTRTHWHDCPVCDGGAANNAAHIGPGLHIGVKAQQDPSLNDGSGIFRMIFPDTETLKYVPEKLQALEMEIERKTVGVNDMVTKEAINVEQVKGSFSSMTTVLLGYKSEFDHLYKWIVKTAGRCIYKQVELTVEANFGTEWYLVSEDDLQTRYDNAKKIGLPSEEQLSIYKQLIQTKYRGNPEKLMREMMVLDLDPYPMLSTEQVITLKTEGAIDGFLLSLKVHFLSFLSRFENENLPITLFGENLEYWDRIKRVRETLYLYNTEMVKEQSDRAPKIDEPINNDKNDLNDEQDD